MSLHKAENPMNLKEFFWPAKMIVSAADSVKPFALAQDTPKTSAHPFIHHWKGRFVTVLEIAITIIKSGVILPTIVPCISISPGIIRRGAIMRIARDIAGAIIRGASSKD